MDSFINTEFFYQLDFQFSALCACNYRAVSGISSLNKTQFQGVWPLDALVKTFLVSLWVTRVVAGQLLLSVVRVGKRCGLVSGRVCEFQANLTWSLLAWSCGQAVTDGSKMCAAAWKSAVLLNVQLVECVDPFWCVGSHVNHPSKAGRWQGCKESLCKATQERLACGKARRKQSCLERVPWQSLSHQHGSVTLEFQKSSQWHSQCI